ncbi:MAG TPA: hypothetical protein VL049_10320 [Candidatus Dormibacteraeota bacterium]|nr:hypothetical protein [Candidatus Dormibacteraeota bacterium]
MRSATLPPGGSGGAGGAAGHPRRHAGVYYAFDADTFAVASDATGMADFNFDRVVTSALTRHVDGGHALMLSLWTSVILCGE